VPRFLRSLLNISYIYMTSSYAIITVTFRDHDKLVLSARFIRKWPQKFARTMDQEVHLPVKWQVPLTTKQAYYLYVYDPIGV
jgi:hypothetical protein